VPQQGENVVPKLPDFNSLRTSDACIWTGARCKCEPGNILGPAWSSLATAFGRSDFTAVNQVEDWLVPIAKVMVTDCCSA
jgi:hypothetical protein